MRLRRVGVGVAVVLFAGLVSPTSTDLVVAETTDPAPRPVPHDRPFTNTEAPVTLPPAGAPAAMPTSEVVSLRTAHAKTFATEQPGTYTSRVYASPIHFEDAAGAWQDIDMTLVPQPDGRLRSRANVSAVSVAPFAHDAQLGRVDFDLDHSVAWRLQGASAVPVEVSQTLGRYTDALPGVSVELRGYWGGLKEDLVLATKSAPDTYLFPLTLRGLTPYLVDGDVVYKDALGKEWGRTPKGWMRDSWVPPAAEDPNQARPQTFSEGVTYELVPHEGATALKMTLDRAWLYAPERVFPVRVDPTTTFNANTDDTYVQTNDTTRNDTFNDLNVGTTSAGANKMRSFIHFDTGFLRGRAKGIGYTRIATYLFDYWGGSGNRPNSMYRVNQGWWGGNMASYPGATVGEEVARREVAASVHWEQWDNAGILDMVHNWNVSQIWADHGIMLMAFDENDNSQYRHYHSANQPGAGPHLVTDWWGLPNLPDSISPVDATYENTPTLQARYTHSNDESGSLVFDVWTDGGGWLGPSRTAGGLCSGCTGTHVPSDLWDGRYQWKVHGRDGAGRTGPQTGSTWFTLDRKPYVPDQLSPATGTADQSPPALSARYDHPNGGNSSGQLIFKLYNVSDTFLSETWSASICKTCTASHTPTGLADGVYKWEAVAYDGGGTGNTRAFSAASERRTFRVDTTAPPAPVVSSTSHPQERTWYPQSAFQASWTEPTDPTGISGYSVVLDQVADTVPPATVSQTTRTFSATLADGVRFLHVRARDGVGNWGPADHYEVWSDAATPGAPTVTSPTHGDSTAWYGDPDFTVNWSGGDTASGLGGWSFAMDGTPDDTSEGTFASSSGLGLADGTHTFRVKRLNNAGTWGTTAAFDLNVDTTPPPAPTVASSTHPDAETWCANDDPSISWSATDTAAPIDGYSWVLDRAAVTDPATDSAAMVTSKSWSDLADGVWWFHVRARNKAGLWGPTIHRAIGIDAVVETPTIASSSHPTQTSWYAVDDVLLSWSAPGHSGITGWSYTFNGTDPDTVSEGTATTRSYPDMPDGTYTFKVRSLDGLGRWSAVAAYAVRVDTSAPLVSSTSSPTHPVEANWYANADPSLSWSSTDTAPVDGYSWVLDRIATTTPDTDSEGTGTSANGTGLADGLWWLHLRARNASGLWTTSTDTIHRAVRIDTTAPTTPPVTSSTHPVEGTWYSADSPSFAFAATDHSGVDGYSWVLDQAADTTPDTASEGTATTKDYTGLADGTWWFHVRSRNGLGMWGNPSHFRVQIDTTNGAPSVSSTTHPSPGTWYSSGAPSLAWSGSWLSGVLGWSYELTQNPATTPDTASEGTATTKDYTGLADGTWWFHVRAQTATTWTQTAHFELRIDGTAPSAPVVSSTTHPSQSTWYSSAHPSVSFATTDTAPVDGYSWVRDQTSTTDPDQSVDTTAAALNFVGLPDGVHWFHVRAVNKAGLWGPTRHFAIRIDATGPAPFAVSSSSHPFQTSWYATDDPAFTFPASDTSGIAGYSFDFDQSPTTEPDTVSEQTTSSKSYADVANGIWWFHVRAVNEAGVWSATTHFKVQVDDTAPAAPSVSSSTHASQTTWYAQPNATLSFPAGDTAPIDGYSWELDQSPGTTPDTTSEGPANSATVTPGEGTYWFHVRARNGSGLWSAPSHYTLKTDAVTGTATVSSSTHPDPNAWYPSRAVELAWTASEESGIAGYSTSITPDVAGNPGTSVTTSTPSASFTVVEDRVWYLNVRVKSNTGVWGPTSSYRLRVDTTAPSAPTASSSTHPDPARWYSNAGPSFGFPASDLHSGVSGYSYEFDHNATTVPDTVSEGGAVTKAYTDVADGVWWFHVRARDNAGNWGVASHVQVRVDDTAPTPQSVSDTPDPLNINNPITFSVGWVDDPNGSPVRAVVCKTNSLAGGSCPGDAWATSQLGVLSPRVVTSAPITTAQGQYDYWAFVCDAADNCSPTAQVGSFRVNDHPSLTSTRVDPPQVAATYAVDFIASWSDGDDSVRTVVCKTDLFSGGVCPGGYWANGPLTSGGSSTGTSGTSDNDIGWHQYWVWICDQGNLCSGPQTGEFTVVPNGDSSSLGNGAANTSDEWTLNVGTQNYTHPCQDNHFLTWSYGIEIGTYTPAWEFKHNFLSYPPDGFVKGTEGMSPEQARQFIRLAINAGPGGWNEIRPDPCTVYGNRWTQFRDTGTYTENPWYAGDNTNGMGWLDFRNLPPTTQSNCKGEPKNEEPKAETLAAMCILSMDRTGTKVRQWGIAFNVAADVTWSVDLNAPENQPIVQAVATHEVGHVLGIDHPDARLDTDPLYCTRAEEHAALTMYPCQPILTSSGQHYEGGRANYWPYTLGMGDMRAMQEQRR